MRETTISHTAMPHSGRLELVILSGFQAADAVPPARYNAVLL